MQSDNCNLCGNCNELSTLCRVFKRETLGPRLKAALAKQDKKEKIFFTDLLEGSVKWCCPAKLDIDEDVLEMRSQMTADGLQPGFCKEILENFKEHGNPVGAARKDRNYKPYFG